MSEKRVQMMSDHQVMSGFPKENDRFFCTSYEVKYSVEFEKKISGKLDPRDIFFFQGQNSEVT